MFLSSQNAVDLYGKRFETTPEFQVVKMLKANGLPYSYRTLTENVFGIKIEDGDSLEDIADKVNNTNGNRGFLVNGFLILKKRFTVKDKKFNLNIKYGYTVDFDISHFEDEKVIDLLEFLLKNEAPYLEGLKERVCDTIRTISQNLRDKIAYQNALLERNEFNLALADLRDNYEISQSQKKILEKKS